MTPEGARGDPLLTEFLVHLLCLNDERDLHSTVFAQIAPQCMSPGAIDADARAARI